jgi:hypothetical protein
MESHRVETTLAAIGILVISRLCEALVVVHAINATKIDTDVQTGPSIGWGHGRRLDGHVGCECRPGQPKRDKRHASQQNLFH